MKVILTIASGRRASMTSLIPQLLAQEGWDEMHIWLNTGLDEDVHFLASLLYLDPRIKIKILTKDYPTSVKIKLNNIEFRKTDNLGDWWAENCTDPDAIYVRFDDDIAFVEQGTVKALVDARLKYPDPYLIFPVIINNGVMAYYLEQAGKLEHPQGIGYTPYVFDPLVYHANLWYDIHEQFLDKVNQHGVEYFHIPDQELAPQHISINCMTYFGRDIAKWKGDFGLCGEEAFITTTAPFRDNRNLMILGSKVVSHYAFFTQRKFFANSPDDEDYHFVNQMGVYRTVQSEIMHRYQNDEAYRQKVSKKIRYHNLNIKLLERYRKLHNDLYNIVGFPITLDYWDWKQLANNPTEFDFSKFKLPAEFEAQD